jgi:putative ABC transport system substrate-binding protein
MATTQIGIMHSGTPGKHKSHTDALEEGIKSLGLSDVGVDPDFKIAATKYAKDKPNELKNIAQELDKPNIDIIVAAGGTASALAAKEQTAASGSGKKVVFTSVAAWPVVVDNMTGIIARTTALDPDRLEKLAKLLPGNAKVGVLLNAKRPDYKDQKTALTRKASELKLQKPDFQDIDPTDATDVETQINAKFTYWKTTVAGVVVAADSLFNNHRDGPNGIISAAAANNLPTIYQWSEFADDGGLISYGPNSSLAYFLAGVYVGYIIKGATPASLTPLSLNNLEMVINLKTAKDLTNFGGIPIELLASADRIITKQGGNIPSAFAHAEVSESSKWTPLDC